MKNTVKFEPDVKLSDVLARVCAKRGLTLSYYVITTRAGSFVALDSTLSGVGQSEVYLREKDDESITRGTCSCENKVVKT